MDKTPKNDHSVIAMSDYHPKTGFAAIAQVEAYWEALRANRLLPKRSDIDPRGIEQALENAFILERIAPGVGRLRIAGSHLNDLLGMEVRGMPITALFTAKARPTVSELLEEVVQMPATCILELQCPSIGGQAAFAGRMVLLPLKSDLGDVSRILGCLVSQGATGTTPRRFDVTRKTLKPITLTPAALPEAAPSTTEPAPPPAAKPAQGFAEDSTAFVPKPKAPQRPPYLRLVKSDD